MTDPLDDLKNAFAEATPAPDAAKKAAILAMSEKNFDRVQGSADATRPTPDRPEKRAGIAQGVRHMLTTLTSRPALTATTALVAVGMVVLIPIVQKMPDGPGAVLEQPEIVTTGRTDTAEVDVTPEPAGPVDTASPKVQPPVVDQVVVMPDESPMVLAEEAEADFDDAAGGDAESLEAPVPSVVAPPAPGRLTRERTFAGGTTADGFSAGALNSVPGLVAPAPAPDLRIPAEPDTEEFANAEDNPVKVVSEDPVSTFSIDVDTASYAVVRSSLMGGALPPADAVRIEEMVNYFNYSYPAPEAGEGPFKPTVTLAKTPWNPDTQLMTIALQGELPAVEDRPPLNLVFLIDTSGSMESPNKLPLLRQSFRLMLGELRPEDQVAIVTYAGSAGLVLEATEAANRTEILAALDRLSAGGSTAGQAGLQQAYAVADEMAAEGEVTRVILATDGDFNVGIHDPDELKDYIETKRDSGTYLSVLGFGRGNLDDATMQALAQNGNGTAAYIDTLSEAQKVLVDQLTGALFPIANDVKIQVEFNPAEIAEYRLIGYETRALRREDFNNDKVDAGEIGAGHSVTAIYEITPVGSPAVLNDPLRYAADDGAGATAPDDDGGELAFLRLRYKTPGADTSQLLELPVVEGMGSASVDAGFAAAIAGFAQLLKDGNYTGDWTYADAIALANANRGDDPFGYRRQAVELMRLAQSLSQ